MTNSYSVSSENREGVEVYTLCERDRARAEIAPALGNNCFAFRTRADVLEPIPFADFRARPTSYGIPILFPFPNRIRDGRFSFQGERYTVNPPRHGFVRDKEWRVDSHGASAEAGAWLTCVLDADTYPEEILGQFPFPFRLEVTYRIKHARLEMETSATNTGARDMPAGYGIHPYFRRPATGTLNVPARHRLELADSLPTGQLLDADAAYDLRRPADVTTLDLDDIYTSIEADADGLARCVLDDQENNLKTVVEFPREQFPYVVVYTPPAPRRAICVEPNTCPTDAFNLHARGVESNLLTIAAGETIKFNIAVYTESQSSAPI
ncbi:MAG: aldose 1-epimerase [Pyrinomonadaceae bacterium]|jgi:aldose 1-epimerase|nr:aldose 1-epimerase [Pyrinomonadaceae bacterium]